MYFGGVASKRKNLLPEPAENATGSDKFLHFLGGLFGLVVLLMLLYSLLTMTGWGTVQLAERLNGIQEFSGSIPRISTKTASHKVKPCGWFLVLYVWIGYLPPSEVLFYSIEKKVFRLRN